MHSREITYTDYDGNTRTEKFLFNLNKAELIQWLSTTGDYTLDKVLLRLAEKRNGKEVMKIFEDLIYLTYGEKSLDGRRFDKSEEVKKNFMQTEAYSMLFTELVTDGAKAAEFIRAVIPKELTDELEEVFKNNPDGIPAEFKDYIPPELVSGAKEILNK